MPVVLIVNDNASFASSDTFSTQHSTEKPRRQLSRRNTVSQLTRKVSKRISQSILGGVTQHELSEKNLKSLDCAPALDPHSPHSPDHQFHHVTLYDPIREDIEEECPSINVEAQREARLYDSYAAFCEKFTMSGTTTRMSRQFDLSMGTDREENNAPPQTEPTPKDNGTLESLHSPTYMYPEYITVYSEPGPTSVAFPISCSPTNRDTPTFQSTGLKGKSHECSRPDTPIYEDKLTKQNPMHETARLSYPRPPPQIITPDVYMNMQREERERKAARRQRLLNPFRSWFLNSRTSWTQRYEVVE
ncbi:uncharacterized protein N7529_010419 [Penicillium soppii]|jgi:hypothetical protein|uniref:uncharacterized protein n=1 Tax=Penicillium soppii TaxID=69789 RepID=UPI002546D49B|nr:uncharacterized protein N7529_010419 [Penicillium soppii]KAJ5856475.1 hypothetical protein N7529_010419 [Penicillium soppii]